MAAEAMRRVLIDHARGRNRVKRGGGAAKRALADVADLAADQDGDQIMALDEAIRRFEQEDAQAAQVVKLRLLRRSQCRGDGRVLRAVRAHREARLAIRPGVAVSCTVVTTPPFPSLARSRRIMADPTVPITNDRVKALFIKLSELPHVECAARARS